MPCFWRKVVKHPTEVGAVKVAGTTWPNKYLTPFLGKQVWVYFDDLNVTLAVYEKAYSGFICNIDYGHSDAGKAYSEREQQRFLEQEQAELASDED